jgi:hypothetical protein
MSRRKPSGERFNRKLARAMDLPSTTSKEVLLEHLSGACGQKATKAGLGIGLEWNECQDIAGDMELYIVETRLGTFSIDGDFHGWLYRIARNMAIDMLDAKVRRQQAMGRIHTEPRFTADWTRNQHSKTILLLRETMGEGAREALELYRSEQFRLDMQDQWRDERAEAQLDLRTAFDLLHPQALARPDRVTAAFRSLIKAPESAKVADLPGLARGDRSVRAVALFDTLIKTADQPEAFSRIWAAEDTYGVGFSNDEIAATEGHGNPNTVSATKFRFKREVVKRYTDGMGAFHDDLGIGPLLAG